MKIRFETYGPFVLKRDEKEAISTEDVHDFWDEIMDSKESEVGLDLAIGVYILSLTDGKTAKPWYVGKTDSGFRHRLIQHARDLKLFSNLNRHAPAGNIEVIFIARRNSTGKGFKKPTSSRKAESKSKNRKHESIDFLESLLIGACYSQNESLLNVQKMAHYRDTTVSGFMNEKDGKLTKAATYLKRLLK
jgi:hypothetical protein